MYNLKSISNSFNSQCVLLPNKIRLKVMNAFLHVCVTRNDTIIISRIWLCRLKSLDKQMPWLHNRCTWMQLEFTTFCLLFLKLGLRKLCITNFYCSHPEILGSLWFVVLDHTTFEMADHAVPMRTCIMYSLAVLGRIVTSDRVPRGYRCKSMGIDIDSVVIFFHGASWYAFRIIFEF